MTVGQLQKSLAALNSDLPIILQKDAEGNGYSPLATYALGCYLADNIYSGEFSEEDIVESVPALVLVPMN